MILDGCCKYHKITTTLFSVKYAKLYSKLMTRPCSSGSLSPGREDPAARHKGQTKTSNLQSHLQWFFCPARTVPEFVKEGHQHLMKWPTHTILLFCSLFAIHRARSPFSIKRSIASLYNRLLFSQFFIYQCQQLLQPCPCHSRSFHLTGGRWFCQSAHIHILAIKLSKRFF